MESGDDLRGRTAGARRRPGAAPARGRAVPILIWVLQLAIVIAFLALGAYLAAGLFALAGAVGEWWRWRRARLRAALGLTDERDLA